ncbi:MAG: GHMP kinase [Acetobacterium woodii]|nr:GHMP kinase [Acetobacterium woodii]MBI5677201.1 GHMP kinase [Planctomycetota bacterium]
MIISKTPFRISLVGGGTDLKSFYKDYPGGVISTCIDKYIYLSMHEYFHPSRYLLKYSKTEEVGSVDEINHNIIREVFRYFGISNVDFNSTADIPAGTGMGSSSAFTCGLVNLCCHYQDKNLPNYEIARLACHFEIDILHEPIGKQDQYGCAVGGLKYIQFNPDETVEIKPILMPYPKYLKLQNNLLLFSTNSTRSAFSILKEQNNNTIESFVIKENLKNLAHLASQLFNDLNKGNIDAVGAYLDEAWQRKKMLASKISNAEIDNIYNIALQNGATGGKLLGAGGGGFLLFYVPEENHEKIRKALKIFRELPFEFDFEGTKIIFRKYKTL